MTTQRTIHLHSAPMSACLRAFWRAASSGMFMSSRPESRLNLQGMGANNWGSSNGIKRSNVNRNFSHQNSVQLRGSA